MSNVIWLMLLLALPVWGQPTLPKPEGWVYDAAHVLDAATKAQLNALAADVEQQTSAEIAIVVVETTVYSVPRNQPLWAAVSETKNPKNLQSAITELVKGSVKELQKQGLARSVPK